MKTSNWRQSVKDWCGDKLIYLDPCNHKLERYTEYTVWDLHAVKQSDIVFVVMESENLSGFGLTVEIGYAKGLGKTVILCDLKSKDNPEFKKMFEIVRSTADIVFDEISEATEYLQSFGRM